jgi:hypothetical protein
LKVAQESSPPGGHARSPLGVPIGNGDHSLD